MSNSENLKTVATVAGAAGLAGLGLAALKPKKIVGAEQPGTAGEEDYSDMNNKEILEKLLEINRSILSALQSRAGITSAVIPNCNNIRAIRVYTLVGTATRLPTLFVPDEMELKIKAGWANAGQIYIGESPQAALNVNQAEPLIRSEFTTYKVKNADALYIAGTVAGDFVTIVAEQRS